MHVTLDNAFVDTVKHLIEERNREVVFVIHYKLQDASNLCVAQHCLPSVGGVCIEILRPYVAFLAPPTIIVGECEGDRNGSGDM